MRPCSPPYSLQQVVSEAKTNFNSLHIGMGCGGAKAVDAVKPGGVVTGLTFAWPKIGSVLVRTVKFRAEFDPRTQELSIKLNDRKVTESELTWENGAFSMQDTKTVDTVSTQSAPGSGLKLQFFVGQDGRFRDMLSTQDVLDQIARIQRVTLTLDQVHKATNKLVNEVKSQWNHWVELWLSPQTSSGSTESFGKACLKMTSTIEHKDDVTDFLSQKFGDGITDVIMAETSDSVNAVIEQATMRPHIVKVRKYRYLCLDVNGKQVREMWEEMCMSIFCWKDIPDLGNDKFLKTEMEKLSAGIGKVIEIMNERIAYLQNGGGEEVGDLEEDHSHN